MVGTTTIEQFVLTILALIVLIICGGCIYAFIHAIFLFVFSQGDDDKKTSAWNSIRYMIIGIILTITLLTIFPILFKQLNITGYENFSARSIFNRAGELLNGLLQLGDLVTNSQTSPYKINDDVIPPDYSL